MTRRQGVAVAVAVAVAGLAVVAALGCAPPDRGVSAPGARLYVVNGTDASVSLVDPGSGRGLGTVPVPHGTQQAVAGRVGSDEATAYALRTLLPTAARASATR